MKNMKKNVIRNVIKNMMKNAMISMIIRNQITLTDHVAVISQITSF